MLTYIIYKLMLHTLKFNLFDIIFISLIYLIFNYIHGIFKNKKYLFIYFISNYYKYIKFIIFKDMLYKFNKTFFK